MQKTYKCKECGKRIKVVEDQMGLFTSRLCFRCNFWHKYVTWEDTSTRIAVRRNRHHYIAEMDTTVRGPRGYGGALFVIEMNNGRVILCDNVWCQGYIPDTFKERLPDNGRFLTANEVIERDLFRDMGDRRKTISHFS